MKQGAAMGVCKRKVCERERESSGKREIRERVVGREGWRGKEKKQGKGRGKPAVRESPGEGVGIEREGVLETERELEDEEKEKNNNNNNKSKLYQHKKMPKTCQWQACVTGQRQDFHI